MILCPWEAADMLHRAPRLRFVRCLYLCCNAVVRRAIESHGSTYILRPHSPSVNEPLSRSLFHHDPNIYVHIFGQCISRGQFDHILMARRTRQDKAHCSYIFLLETKSRMSCLSSGSSIDFVDSSLTFNALERASLDLFLLGIRLSIRAYESTCGRSSARNHNAVFHCGLLELMTCRLYLCLAHPMPRLCRTPPITCCSSASSSCLPG